MAEFFDALRTHSFLQIAVLTGILISVACGIIGTYVATRRITYIAAGIAHCTLGGMGVARYLEVVHGLSFVTPMRGAVAAALLAAVIIATVSLRAKQNEDSIIGALWAIGMATGILFIAKTPGYNEDLMSYLFGDILTVRSQDLFLIVILDLVVIAAGVIFYNPLVAVCFDEEFARLRGIKVEVYYVMLLCLTALTVVLLVTVVGIVMVIALLTIPAAIAGNFAKSIWQMMVLSVLLCVAFTTTGLAVSYSPDLPAGATIIIIAGIAYIATTCGKAIMGKRKGI